MAAEVKNMMDIKMNAVMVSPVCQFLILIREMAAEVKNIMDIKMNAVMVSPVCQFLITHRTC
jgi:hypothetical protein